MTIEELKEEAKKMGYKLVKDRPNIKLLPCPCGKKNGVYFDYTKDWQKFAICSKCGLRGSPAKRVYEARENWNKAVQESGRLV